MLVLRLLAVGILSGTFAVSSAHDGPRGTIVVQVVHRQWPDGSPVESGGNHYPTDLYAVDTDGGQVRNLTHDPATNYLVGRLPDGRILYESVPSDRMRSGSPGIFSIEADGTGRRLLASGTDAKLAPDGSRVMFARGRWLYVVRADGTGETRLVQMSFGYYVPPVWYETYDASWSPDAKRIVFVRGFAERQAYGGPFHPRSALFVVNVDGSGMSELTKVRPKVEILNPAWSPDGSRILYEEHSYTAVTTNDHSYVMRVAGSGAGRLTRLERTDLFWLPNGRLAFSGSSRGVSLAADGTDRRTLPARVRLAEQVWITSGPRAGYWPVSPDGKWIALIRPWPQTLAIERIDGTGHRPVTAKLCCYWSTWAIGWAGG